MSMLNDPGLFGRQWAATYDTTDNPDPSDAVELLAALAAPGARVLELAIGSGRVAIPLAARGFAVEGIEASPEMVELMRAKPGGEQIPVVIGDMADVAVEGPYALAYLVFNTLFNLTVPGAQEACFRNVARVLAPGAAFVIETFVPREEDFDRDERTVQVRAVTDRSVTLRLHQYDRGAQTFVRQTVTLTNEGVRLKPFGMRYQWPGQIDAMAADAGLALESRFATFAREPYTDDSAGHVSVYRKPAA